jgi:hypothetical protein
MGIYMAKYNGKEFLFQCYTDPIDLYHVNNIQKRKSKFTHENYQYFNIKKQLECTRSGKSIIFGINKRKTLIEEKILHYNICLGKKY